MSKDIIGPVDKVTDVLGKKCPNCGAEGKWHGEHETVVRNFEAGRVKPEMIKLNIVDVGWRCWNCGWEWGFEVQEGDKVRNG